MPNINKGRAKHQNGYQMWRLIVNEIDRKVAYGLLTAAFYCCFLLLFSSNMAISALMDNDIGILKQVWSTNILKFTRMIQMFQIKQSIICRLTSASVWYICLLLGIYKGKVR